MRPRPSLRAAGALSLAITAALPAAAHADEHVGIDKRRLDVRAGHRVAVTGDVRPAVRGAAATLQLRRHGRWKRLDRDRTARTGHYILHRRMRAPLSAPARLLVRAHGARTHRRLGRLNAYRVAFASWYGPGLYGNRLGCGGTLTAGRLGVAHKTLPCGTRVTLRHGRRQLRVPVIDRGPYVAGREYDLTAATARRLRFHGHGAILSTR